MNWKMYLKILYITNELEDVFEDDMYMIPKKKADKYMKEFKKQ